MAKLSFVAGVGVGYVLGARAGRKRYEQIKAQAGKMWRSEPVQTRVHTATDKVKDQAAPFVTEKLGGAVKSVGQSVSQSRRSAPVPARNEQLPETIHRRNDGQLEVDTTGFGPGGDKLP
jgi:hypothetical protein